MASKLKSYHVAGEVRKITPKPPCHSELSFEAEASRARYYYLPLLKNCLPGCEFCIDLGCRNHYDRNIDDVHRALKRARSADSTGVVFSASILTSSLCEDIIDLCVENLLRPIVQISWQALTPEVLSQLKTLGGRGVGVNLLLGGGEDVTGIENFLKEGEMRYCTWVVRRDADLANGISALTSLIRARLHLYLPFKHRLGDRNISTAQAQRQLRLLHLQLPDFVIRPPLGVEIWNNKIDANLGLEPIERPAAVSYSELPKIEISVVIPSYNNSVYLLNTLRHLQMQNLDPNRFEVVVVDDGSVDNTHLELLKFIREHKGRFNCKYIFFPRHKDRKMGDGNFRAGIARNLGVKNAAGELLCFLDSDILTPKDFLENLLSKHELYDVVQCTRLNLKESMSHASVNYTDVRQEQDTFFTDGRYWETFYACRDWVQLPFFWKYVCTYGLSMKKDVFKSVGWLKRTFVYYGFEDTELGYRLAKAGYRFHLNPIITYHLFHGNHRSEYSNQDWQRHRLLSKTAKIFYQHILDVEVFEHFRAYLEDSFGLLTRAYERIVALFAPTPLRTHEVDNVE